MLLITRYASKSLTIAWLSLQKVLISHQAIKIIPGFVNEPGPSILKAELKSPSRHSQALCNDLGARLRRASTVQPLCIVSPESAQDVSTAVSALTKVNATATNPVPGCHFAIRSGGYTYFTGASNIQGGVTIDLRALNDIEPNQDGPSLLVGVGATWGMVYAQLDNFNLSVAGARAANVGVGGLTIGGGISYFGPRYGWACDMVTNFEVVLYNGSIINANDDENPDLLWALRGGSGNLGIVTRVKLQAFEQEQIWGGVVHHTSSSTNEQVAYLAEYSNPANYDEFSSLISTFAYSGAYGAAVIVNNMEYTKAVVNPPIFQPLLSITSLSSTMRITNMTDLSRETQRLQLPGSREASATITIEPTAEAINATVQAWNASVPSIQEVPGIVWSIVLEPLPPAIYARHAETNALGLADRQGRGLMIVMLSMTWSDAEDDDKIETVAKTLVANIEGDVRQLNALDRYVYLNYAAAWQKPITSYGQASVDRLANVRREYDPRKVFTDNVPGGFKLHE
ncbi:hypothetical protein N0V90_009599 [Kalmusia sp. IMI 367209]|nr:hypothetical protein N0V90_009599 [Kalmusia sp. IMI 367209]